MFSVYLSLPLWLLTCMQAKERSGEPRQQSHDTKEKERNMNVNTPTHTHTHRQEGHNHQQKVQYSTEPVMSHPDSGFLNKKSERENHRVSTRLQRNVPDFIQLIWRRNLVLAYRMQTASGTVCCVFTVCFRLHLRSPQTQELSRC